MQKHRTTPASPPPTPFPDSLHATPFLPWEHEESEEPREPGGEPNHEEPEPGEPGEPRALVSTVALPSFLAHSHTSGVRDSITRPSRPSHLTTTTISTITALSSPSHIAVHRSYLLPGTLAARWRSSPAAREPGAPRVTEVPFVRSGQGVCLALRAPPGNNRGTKTETGELFGADKKERVMEDD
ncbi:Protein of unknown function [Pyronema omphalodes CBS 100304]|uniref:Uncharacterized protein n=1 Tax=Pyronema omphalodes (strain CBS 100304) TaxID=1076935 RepID=U4L5A2_PYROM|nr:Protein of unknown function [Pyronema omphalodes CBS 100304]